MPVLHALWSVVKGIWFALDGLRKVLHLVLLLALFGVLLAAAQSELPYVPDSAAPRLARAPAGWALGPATALAQQMALTPISAFRPRRWHGALLPDHAKIQIDVNEPNERPVSAVADHTEFRDVSRVQVSMDRTIDLVLLHDPGHSLDERILREQFKY